MENDRIKVLKELVYKWTRMSTRKQGLNSADGGLDHEALSAYRAQHVRRINFPRSRDDVSKSGEDWDAIMGTLELDHYGYLLEKVVKLFRRGEEPHEEVTNAELLLIT